MPDIEDTDRTRCDGCGLVVPWRKTTRWRVTATKCFCPDCTRRLEVSSNKAHLVSPPELRSDMQYHGLRYDC